MQILSIQLKNIKSHRNTELHFSPGINVLAGPNGAGKSTVFEAIGYALFGVDAQNFVGNVERFLTIGTKRGEISVTFQPAGAECFRVSRTVGTPAKWLLAKEVGGTFEVEEHKDARETETRLKELLGLDNGRPLAEQFTLVIGPFQNEFLGPFVIKQAAKRRDEFDAILGIDSWRKTFTETNAILKAIKGKADVLHAEIGARQEQIAVLPTKREARQTATGDLAQAQHDLQRQQGNLTSLEARLTGFDQQEQVLKALQSEIDRLKERIAVGQEKITGQKLLVAESEKAQAVITTTTSGRQAFEQAETRLAQLREQEKNKRDLDEELNQLDKLAGKLDERYAAETRDIERVRAELNEEEQVLARRKQESNIHAVTQTLAARLPEIRRAIEGLRSEVGQLEGQRAGLNEGREKLAKGICPFLQEPCRNIADQPQQDVFTGRFADLDAEHRRLSRAMEKLGQEELAAGQASDELKSVEVQRRELEVQALKLSERRKKTDERAAGLKALQQEQATVTRQLTEKRQVLQGFSSLGAEIEAAEQDRRNHKEARDLFVANQKQAAELEKRQTELQRFVKLLEELQGESAAKEAQLKQAGSAYEIQAHAELRQQLGALRETVGELRQKVSNLHDSVARLTDEIARLEAISDEIAQRQTRLTGYVKKEELVKFLRNRVFRNVSGYLSERFREEISQRANRIYRTIAESDEELAWGEDYRIVLRDMVDGALRERSDDQLSGGQTMSAVVALRLAMLQTIGARIAFFDEPTSNLDATRRENLASAFRAIDIGQEEVAEHWYDQLFLISHDVAFTEVTDQVLQLGE